MKNFLSAVVGGAIGLAALYVVGKVAYQMGHDMAEAEHHYSEVRRKTEELEQSSKKEDGGTIKANEQQVEETAIAVATPIKTQSKLGLMVGLKRMLGKRESVLSNLVHNPEAHRLEAFVEGEELHVNVKPRTA